MKAQVVIELTEEQIEKLRPLYEKMIASRDNGDRGVIIGQPDPFTAEPDRVYFAFVSGEKAFDLQRIMNPKGLRFAESGIASVEVEMETRK